MKVINYSEDKDNQTVTIQLKLITPEFDKFNIQKFKLDSLYQASNDYLEVEKIIAIVCDHFEMPISLIRKIRKSGKLLKNGHLVDVRRLCYHFVNKHSRMKLSAIGSLFGQGHANVMYHLGCIEAWKETDGELAATLKQIESKIDKQIKG